MGELQTAIEIDDQLTGCHLRALRNHLPPAKYLCIYRKGDIYRVMTFHWKNDEWAEIGRGSTLQEAIFEAHVGVKQSSLTRARGAKG